jgi:hypothetical protein
MIDKIVNEFYGLSIGDSPISKHQSTQPAVYPTNLKSVEKLFINIAKLVHCKREFEKLSTMHSESARSLISSITEDSIMNPELIKSRDSKEVFKAAIQINRRGSPVSTWEELLEGAEAANAKMRFLLEGAIAANAELLRVRAIVAPLKRRKRSCWRKPRTTTPTWALHQLRSLRYAKCWMW